MKYGGANNMIMNEASLLSKVFASVVSKNSKIQKLYFTAAMCLYWRILLRSNSSIWTIQSVRRPKLREKLKTVAHTQKMHHFTIIS